MSHTVTVTRTTTTTSTSAIILNTGYCKTLPGLLKIAEIVLGVAIIVLLFGLLDSKYNLSLWYGGVLFFHHMVVTFFIGSSLLLIGCLVSISTGSIIAKTSYEFIYHGGAFILYLIATLLLIIKIHDYDTRAYRYYFISAALAVVNCVLYCISTILAYRSYRWP